VIDDRIYTERKILTGVLVGGPLAGGYYFWRTFNAFEKRKQAVTAVAIALIVLVATVASLYIPVLDKVPNFAFWALQGGLTLGAIRGYLSTEMTEHVEAGNAVYGWGNTIAVAVISLTITFGLILALIFASPVSLDNMTNRSYGNLKHEIVFDPENISEPEVDRIAKALMSIGFFDEEVQKTVDAAKSDGHILITVYCTEEARSPEVIEMYRMLRADVQKSFPTDRIVLDMVVGTPDNRIARLE
jgi:hypothetical protein